MTENSKRLLIASIAAAVLIGGSVAAIALTNDSGSEDRPVRALAEELAPSGPLLELLRGLRGDDGQLNLPDGIQELWQQLRDDLVPQNREQAPDDAAPDSETPAPPRGDRPRLLPGPLRGNPDRGDGFGFWFGEGPDGSTPFGQFFGDGRLGPGEAQALERLLRELFANGVFGNGMVPGQPFVIPGVPGNGEVIPRIGDLPLEEFLQDGRITPDEARELERLWREAAPDAMFNFGYVPPDTDASPPIPDGLFEGLRGLPFGEFLADGELTPEEQEILRAGVNEWLDRIFGRVNGG